MSRMRGSNPEWLIVASNPAKFADRMVISFEQDGCSKQWEWDKQRYETEEGWKEQLYKTETKNCGTCKVTGSCRPLQQEDCAPSEHVCVAITDSARVEVAQTVCKVEGFQVDSVELRGDDCIVTVTLFYKNPLCECWNIVIPGVEFVFRSYPGKNQGYRILQFGIFGSVKNSLTEALCECSATAARKRKAGESSSQASKSQKSERRTSAFADEQKMQDVVEGDGSGHFLVSFETDDEHAMNFASLTLIAMQARCSRETLT